MEIILGLIVMLILAYIGLEALRLRRRENLIERLNYGLELDESESPSLWDGAANLLQLNAVRELLYKSAIVRKFDLMLKRSGLNIHLTQALFIFFLVTIIPTAIIFFYWKTFVSVLVGLLLIPLAIWGMISFLAKRMQSRLDAQLPALISNFLTTIGAGGTPIQALQSASRNANPPLKNSLTYLLEMIQLGRSPQQSWQEWADYWDTRSARLLATGIKIKWETGGQMTAILQHVQETLEFNRKMDLRVSTLTAQAKLSAWVLSALPIGLGMLTKAYRPDLFNVMLTDDLGKTLLYSAGLMTLVGFFWLRKIAKLKS